MKDFRSSGFFPAMDQISFARAKYNNNMPLKGGIEVYSGDAWGRQGNSGYMGKE
jgi:hypothetical protein